MKSNRIIEVYHGTAGFIGTRIQEYGAIKPRPGNRFVYLTTDIEVARQYSKAWTAWALEDLNENVQPEGVIFKARLTKKIWTEKSETRR